MPDYTNKKPEDVTLSDKVKVGAKIAAVAAANLVPAAIQSCGMAVFSSVFMLASSEEIDSSIRKTPLGNVKSAAAYAIGKSGLKIYSDASDEKLNMVEKIQRRHLQNPTAVTPAIV